MMNSNAWQDFFALFACAPAVILRASVGTEMWQFCGFTMPRMGLPESPGRAAGAGQ